MKVAVIGAGIMGSCTAWRLAERGHDVTIYEQFEPGHMLGSSHGRSRIIRKAYPDPFYTKIMQTGYPMWRELEAKSGQPLVHECGLLYFGKQDAENMRSMMAGMRDLGVDHELLYGPEVGERFGELRTEVGDVGVWQPEAGWVDAGLCTRTALTLAQSLGARLVKERVDLGVAADRVIVCAGAWVRDFVGVPVVVTRQAFTYLRHRHEGPVWIEDGPNNLYGFPVETADAAGSKVACHVPGSEFDVRSDERVPLPGDADPVIEFARRRWGIEEPEVIEQGVCLYTTTADEHFRVGRIDERSFYASPCSGHGFKFGPWIGALMADLVEEKASVYDYSP